MANFIAPVDNPFLLFFTKTFLLPLFLHYEQLEVHVTERFRFAIGGLKNTQAVLLLPHADRLDFAVAFALSKICKENFYYLAARELFEEGFGLHGWFLSNCGAYSVMRGKEEDIASKDQTVAIIASGRRKLIMFPEGDVTGRDDVILPLKQDGIRNMLAAQQRILEGGAGEPIYLLPVALYYEVLPASWPSIMESVSRLEQHLNLRPPSYELEQRIENLLLSFIEHLEAHYLNSGVRIAGVHRFDKLSLEKRLLHIIELVSKRVADYMGIDLNDAESEADLVHTVLSALYSTIITTTEGTAEKLAERTAGKATAVENTTAIEAGATGPAPIKTLCRCQFCRKLENIHKRQAKSCLDEMHRMQQLLILKSTIKSQPFDMGLAWRILDRLEEQILNRRSPKGHRKVWIDAAEPLSLLEYHAEYQSAPVKAIQHIDGDVRSSLLSTKQELQSHILLSNQAVVI